MTTKTLRLEVGEIYQTANGRKVGPLRAHVNDGLIFVAGDGVVWNRNGSLRFGKSTNGYSSAIIGLWVNAPATVAAQKVSRKGEFKKGGRCDQLLRFLTTGRTITQGEAIVLGFGTRLAATVHDLRGAGHNVVTTMKEDCHGNSYAEYRLVTRKGNGDRKAA